VVDFGVLDGSPVARDWMTNGGSSVVATRRVDDCARVRSSTRVTHSHAALAFYVSGQSRVELNGRWNVGEGDVLLVPAGEAHRTLHTQPMELWSLNLCAPCVVADGNSALLDPLERVRDGAPPVVRIPSERRAYLAALFRELERNGNEPRAASNAIQTSLLTLILAEISDASSHAPNALAGGGVVVDALRFIERNCLRRLGLEEVAAAVRRSPAYVTTALKKATGRSAVQWIVSGRMAAARRLLLASDEKVDTIAERVGYADATHFIRMFRREHGVTPAAWRTARLFTPSNG
jgi:AraC family transcriptional activator of pobA